MKIVILVLWQLLLSGTLLAQGFSGRVLDEQTSELAKPVSDSEFERLSNRFDEIETHCQAFLAQNPNQTPEERVKHEKQVKKCLKEAGIK